MIIQLSLFNTLTIIRAMRSNKTTLSHLDYTAKELVTKELEPQKS